MLLTDDQKQMVRRTLEDSGLPIIWRKAEVAAALLSLEAWFDANKGGIVTLIENAVPGKFSLEAKKVLAKAWFRLHGEMEV